MAKETEKGREVKMGRPTLYSQQLADDICESIATSSKSMKTICAELNIKVATVLNWLCENHVNYREDFSKAYARAKDMQVEYLAEELLEIADDSKGDLLFTDEHGNRIENKEFVNRSKLRVDTRKWIASKLKPKKYGDKLDLEHTGKNGSQLQAPITFISAEALSEEQIQKLLNDRAGN